MKYLSERKSDLHALPHCSWQEDVFGGQGGKHEYYITGYKPRARDALLIKRGPIKHIPAQVPSKGVLPRALAPPRRRFLINNSNPAACPPPATRSDSRPQNSTNLISLLNRPSRPGRGSRVQSIPLSVPSVIKRSPIDPIRRY
ncbi:hypothetical protein J6590_044989 [Homalodisca vitripennis]|nr:hypothetical protein J6590_044989 [Homalodisca vitripennis]